VRSNGTISVQDVGIKDFKNGRVHVENGGVIRARGFFSDKAGADGLRLMGGALEDKRHAEATNATSDGGRRGLTAKRKDKYLRRLITTNCTYNSASQTNGDAGRNPKTYSVIDARSAQTTGNTRIAYSVGLGASIHQE
jgi:hypothetical protein